MCASLFRTFDSERYRSNQHKASKIPEEKTTKASRAQKSGDRACVGNPYHNKISYGMMDRDDRRQSQQIPQRRRLWSRLLSSKSGGDAADNERKEIDHEDRVEEIIEKLPIYTLIIVSSDDSRAASFKLAICKLQCFENLPVSAVIRYVVSQFGSTMRSGLSPCHLLTYPLLPVQAPSSHDDGF